MRKRKNKIQRNNFPNIIKNEFKLRKIILQQLIIFVVAAIGYIIFYEHYPRPGWADAAIYSSYAISIDAYRYVDGFSAALNGATYQHSRLGYIVPLRLLSDYFGPIGGRFIFNATLFFLYCIAIIKFATAIVRNSKNRALVLILLLFNPGIIISIVSGGADGPSAVFSTISLVTLYFAIKNRDGFNFLQAGIWFGLAVAAHLFSLAPYFIATIPFIFLLASGNLFSTAHLCLSEWTIEFKSFFKFFSLFFLGLTSILLLLNAVGNQLGLQKFFLSYSIGRAQNSLQGSGEKFSQPIYFLIHNATPWIGMALFLFIALIFIFKTSQKSEDKYSVAKLKAASLSFLLPLLFVLIFDFLVGGSLIASPHYFSAFFPCFIIGVVFLFSSFDSIKFSQIRFSTLLIAIFLNLISPLFPYNNSAIFTINGIDSKSLLISQVEFKEVTLQLVENKIFNVVYSKAQVSSPEAYVDYFEGKKRSFDYMDTFAYTFPWVGDKMHRVDLSEVRKFNFDLKRDVPTLVLSASSDELDYMLFLMRNSFSERFVKARKCGGQDAYKWCVAIVNYE